MDDATGAGAAADDTQRARRVAQDALPTLADLLGEQWREDPDGELSTEVAVGLPEPCLPDGFPDRAILADAERSFRHGTAGTAGALGVLYAVAATFAAADEAARAWALLADERFARCFAEELAADVGDTPARIDELLGPVHRPAQFSADRLGRRTVEHHARFSRASGDTLLPLGLDIAVVLVAPVVVIVWGAERGGSPVQRTWERLVSRVELRCDAAVGGP